MGKFYFHFINNKDFYPRFISQILWLEHRIDFRFIFFGHGFLFCYLEIEPKPKVVTHKQFMAGMPKAKLISMQKEIKKELDKRK